MTCDLQDLDKFVKLGKYSRLMLPVFQKYCKYLLKLFSATSSNSLLRCLKYNFLTLDANIKLKINPL